MPNNIDMAKIVKVLLINERSMEGQKQTGRLAGAAVSLSAS